jgi:hypothetical protein
MKNMRKCRACETLFEVDYRNEKRHVICRSNEFQRQRRRQAQKARRLLGTSLRKIPVEPVQPPCWPQASVMPTEAAWNTDHPAFIGLISMITGSADLEEIRRISQRLSEQGRNILGLKSPGEVQCPVIHHF